MRSTSATDVPPNFCTIRAMILASTPWQTMRRFFPQPLAPPGQKGAYRYRQARS
jgi:hypothetical protein